ncbi:MAG: OmpA family protein [Chthoniobacter sp.]|uniref:OmpA family protein n=1 Tax=Chthoniobacter sp. TaxID=2510640 RepID=UPI0032A9374F
MKLIRLFSLAALLLATLSFAGCAKGKKGTGGNGSTDGDYVNGSPLPDRQEGVSFLGSNVDRSKFRPVYFGFDSYVISSGERSKIDEVAEFMKSASNTLILAGFTDERGTPEYNRGLGERRAQAVREALIHAGADGSKIQTVSFGAEMPADPGSGDSAWAKNRRAEFGVVR